MIRLDHHQDQAGAWDVLKAARGILAFDVGANIGQATRVLAERFGHVVAFEPCVESFEILAAEMPTKVDCLNVAVSDHEGELTLTETAHSIRTGQLTTGEGLAWGAAVGERTVPCVTLDTMVEKFGPPDFVKIDTEGAEIGVLEGAQRTLAEHRPRVIVEVHREENGPLVRALLSDYDLTELRHGDYVRQGGHTWCNHFWLWGDHAAAI
jgi:FkbM family methyltransferase